MCPRVEIAQGDLYRQLSHPIRREIISLLGSRGAMSATDLLMELGLSAGNFYYHLRLLKGLVAQDERGLYVLTDAGTLAQSKVLSWQDVPGTSFPRIVENRFFSLFSFSNAVDLLRNRAAFLLIPLAVLEVVLYLGSGTVPKGFLIERVSSQDFGNILVGNAVSWMYVIAMSVGFLVATNRKIRMACLAGSYLFAQLPLLLFGSTAPILGLVLPAGLLNAIFMGFQAWSLMIFATGFSKSGNLSLLSAALVTIAAAYLNVVVVISNLPLFA
ncbi:MAG: helix-turn-helix transcriptional regulator [Candidatus Brockarchaeota archaeon]|nr:helix-turn-helix transcriptional regulator [Candidatus Brockarchaeota archaeon]